MIMGDDVKRASMGITYPYAVYFGGFNGSIHHRSKSFLAFAGHEMVTRVNYEPENGHQRHML